MNIIVTRAGIRSIVLCLTMIIVIRISTCCIQCKGINYTMRRDKFTLQFMIVKVTVEPLLADSPRSGQPP